MKEKFIDRRFGSKSLDMIDRINTILNEYRAQGFRLSLRQVYYQCVARALIENSVRSYKNIGNLISAGRQAGLIDWAMIEDRNRETVIPTHWSSPGEIVRAAAAQYRIDKWAGQEYHVEIMVEKDALSGVLVPVCNGLDIGITANKGYSSSSTMYEIAKRLEHKALNNSRSGRPVRNILILYLGDHDPSGIDMTRDVTERLELYSGLDIRAMTVRRLALNMNQIEEWQPPENPAKETDSRFASYRAEYGDSSWELDAIEPSELALLIESAVEPLRDQDKWDRAVETENRMRAELLAFANKYADSDEESEDIDDEP